MKVAELKDLCKSMGFKLTGKKSDLMQRIDEYFVQGIKEQDVSRLLTMRTLVLKRDCGAPLPSYKDLYNAIDGGEYSIATNNQYTRKPAKPQLHARDSQPYRGHNLYFKNNPFFTLRRSIHGSPQILNPTKSKDNCEYKFILNHEENSLLNSDDDSIKVYLLCGQLQNTTAPASTEVEIDFPSPIEIQANGNVISQNYKGIKGKAGTAKPADITEFIKPGAQMNRINILFYQTEATYLVYLYIVKTVSCESLISKIVEKPHIHKNSTIEKIRSQNEDDDIVVSTSSVTLKDPLSYTRMKYPVQSIYCNHSQCFDGLIFLHSQLQIPTWICPYCQISIKIEDLAISDYFQDILDTVPEDVDQVIINEDGSWKVDDESKEETPNTHEDKLNTSMVRAEIEVISLSSDSEEEEEEEEQPQQKQPQNTPLTESTSASPTVVTPTTASFPVSNVPPNSSSSGHQNQSSVDRNQKQTSVVKEHEQPPNVTPQLSTTTSTSILPPKSCDSKPPSSIDLNKERTESNETYNEPISQSSTLTETVVPNSRDHTVNIPPSSDRSVQTKQAIQSAQATQATQIIQTTPTTPTTRATETSDHKVVPQRRQATTTSIFIPSKSRRSASRVATIPPTGQGDPTSGSNALVSTLRNTLHNNLGTNSLHTNPEITHQNIVNSNISLASPPPPPPPQNVNTPGAVKQYVTSYADDVDNTPLARMSRNQVATVNSTNQQQPPPLPTSEINNSDVRSQQSSDGSYTRLMGDTQRINTQISLQRDGHIDHLLNNDIHAKGNLQQPASQFSIQTNDGTYNELYEQLYLVVKRQFEQRVAEIERQFAAQRSTLPIFERKDYTNYPPELKRRLEAQDNAREQSYIRQLAAMHKAKSQEIATTRQKYIGILQHNIVKTQRNYDGGSQLQPNLEMPQIYPSQPNTLQSLSTSQILQPYSGQGSNPLPHTLQPILTKPDQQQNIPSSSIDSFPSVNHFTAQATYNQPQIRHSQSAFDMLKRIISGLENDTKRQKVKGMLGIELPEESLGVNQNGPPVIAGHAWKGTELPSRLPPLAQTLSLNDLPTTKLPTLQPHTFDGMGDNSLPHSSMEPRPTSQLGPMKLPLLNPQPSSKGQSSPQESSSEVIDLTSDNELDN
jgi:hypothetical protein